jgi:hypothetical protein
VELLTFSYYHIYVEMYIVGKSGPGRILGRAVRKGKAMFENEMRVRLTKAMSERVFLLQNFFERSEMETDLSYVGSVGVAMFSDAVEAKLNGFTMVGFSATGECSFIDLDAAYKQIYGKKHEVVVITPISPELEVACQRLAQTINADRVEDAMLWGLYYLASVVGLLEEKNELFYAGATGFQYVPLDAFGKVQPVSARQ